MKYTGFYHSPIGIIKVETSETTVISISFLDNNLMDTESDKVNPVLSNTILQLNEYFSGKRKKFALPIDIIGTEFQQSVLKEVHKIPYGKTSSYKEIAKKINNEKASRAVGSANNKNRLLIVIPCHRVIGSNGNLVGYAGELWRKEWLLNLEKRNNYHE